MKSEFGKLTTEQPSSEIPETFNFDFKPFKVITYIFARKYAQDYLLKYESLKDSKTDFLENKYSTDCFGLVWKVIDDLSKASYVDFESSNISRTISIIKDQISLGNLSEFNDISELYQKEAGIFFILKKSEKGWVVSGSRHFGMWFLFEDQIYVVDILSNQEAREKKMEVSEFAQYLKSFYKAFI